ncbi:hypothetical protein VTJ49DRAFT_5304 [Mycothermus thermophilus]|uniref:F-box domain-containing protein n=1 Tax=Humicola insolens TaxID=85995 RepID=A0ABR3V3H8_HUMIN
MSLLKLPNELLVDIAERFACDLPASLSKCGVDVSDRPIITARLALRDLSWTCRRLNAIATPLLYQNIRIHWAGELYGLAKTFLKSPHLAKFVRAIGMFVDPNTIQCVDDPHDVVVMKSLVRLISTNKNAALIYHRVAHLFSGFQQVFDATVSNEPEDLGSFGKLKLQGLDQQTLREFAQATCAVILSLTSNADTLYLVTPSEGTGHYDLLMQLVHCSDSSKHGEADILLPRLERLRLAADPRINVPLLDPDAPEAFMVGRKVRHVELFGAILSSEFCKFTRDAWKAVETVRMDYANTNGAWWHQFCNEARPPLKHVELSNSPCWYIVVPSDREAPGLNEALGLCKTTLQTLSLDFDDALPVSPSFGPEGKLTCLRSMEALSVLSIQARYLYNSLKDMKSGNICEMLPSSLQQVHFCELSEVCMEGDPWDLDAEDGPTYYDLVKRDLLQLAFKSADWLPRLEQVSLKRRHEWEAFSKVDPEFDARVTWKLLEHPNCMEMTFAPKR